MFPIFFKKFTLLCNRIEPEHKTDPLALDRLASYILYDRNSWQSLSKSSGWQIFNDVNITSSKQHNHGISGCRHTVCPFWFREIFNRSQTPLNLIKHIFICWCPAPHSPIPLLSQRGRLEWKHITVTQLHPFKYIFTNLYRFYHVRRCRGKQNSNWAIMDCFCLFFFSCNIFILAMCINMNQLVASNWCSAALSKQIWRMHQRACSTL